MRCVGGSAGLVLALGTLLHGPTFARALEAPGVPAPATDGGEPPPPDGGVPAPAYQSVVTTLRLPRPQADVPAATIVIPRDEIARSPALTTDDLVREVPSVSTFRYGSSLAADPSSQSLNLRGLGPSAISRALLLQDGVPVNDPFGGWIYWRSLPMLDIDRIEISPSGASALYGNFALGGVAQLLSRPIGAPEAEAEVEGGMLDSREAAARGAGRWGRVGAELTAETLGSAGYAPIAPSERGPIDGPAPSQDVNVGSRLELHPTDHLLLRATARYFDEQLNAGTDFTAAAARAFTYGVSAQLDGERRGAFDLSLFGGDREYQQDRARVTAGRQSAFPAASQDVPTNDQGASFTYTAPALHGLGEHVLLVGTDLRRVAGTATQALYPAAVGPSTVVSTSAGGEQQFLGVFAQDAAKLPGRLEASAALRLDAFRSLAGESTALESSGQSSGKSYPDQGQLELSPHVGLLEHATPWLSLRASGYRAFRAPTLDELYRPFQVGTILTDANPALEAETLWGGEAGAEITLAALDVSVTGFYNQLFQPIDNVTLAAPLPDGATRQRENLGQARVPGVELTAAYRPGRRFRLVAGYTFVDPVVTSAPAEPWLVGKLLALDPEHRASVIASFSDPRFLTATVQARWEGPQFEDDRNTLPIGGYLVVDASASRLLWWGFTAFASVTNLLGESYLVGRAGVDTVGEPLVAMVGLRWQGSVPR
ncbi:MAG: TonB-dependent receptor plug domain-containing protein [Myxococcales bacterium]